MMYRVYTFFLVCFLLIGVLSFMAYTIVYDAGVEEGRALGIAEASISGKDAYLITLRPINNPESPVLQLRARFEMVDYGK